MNKIGLLLICILILLGSSCSEEEPKQSSNTSFFDLTKYFEDQKEALREVKSFRKSVRLDQKSEEKILSSVDISTELDIFSNSNINKNAWFDKYEVDSVFQQNHLSALHYTALDQKLKTKKLSIFFSNASVDSIHIKNSANNIVVNSDQRLKYIPKKGYHILSTQTVTSQPEHALAVDVEFVY